jgi:peptidoglycan hydrolase-like protein with peptidoglycan-binding domain
MPSGYPSIWSIPSDALPLKVGFSGMNVRKVERALIARGHGIAADGVYGSATASAVKVRQRTRNRAVTGEVASDDWLFMFPPLRIRGRGGRESHWRFSIGYGGVDTTLRSKACTVPAWADAVTLFQQRRGLTTDGVVNQLTWRQLFKK